MKHEFLRVVSTSIFAFGALGPGSAVSAQGADHAEHEALLERIVLEGTVLEANGAPAAGARVVTSAGGSAVADASGRYRIEVRIASDASSVQVSAMGATGVKRAASATLTLPARSGRVQVGSLSLVHGVTCEPSWVPTFGGAAGVAGGVGSLAVYDDGGGPALYVGGGFESAGGVKAAGIAKWDGSSWTSLGSEAAVDGTVNAMIVHDDGSGPALFVGGRFDTAGGVVVNNVAKWNGSTWSALGAGTSGVFGEEVFALAVFDDGGGPALYAGGEFTNAGSAAALRVAKWDGSAWTTLGPGLRGGPRVDALMVYDDGSGPALLAGGLFGLAGDLPVTNIARWNGSSWAALGSGVSSGVNALAVYDDGSGSALYAGGLFGIAGGMQANRIAKWNGSSWATLGSGVDDTVLSLAVHDDGGGSALYAGGVFRNAGGGSANGIARWDGASWQALSSGLQKTYGHQHSVYAMAAFDDGGGTALFPAGSFTSAGGTPVSSIARWDGSSWAALGGGPNWVNGEVLALAEYDDGSGPAVCAGGLFASAGSQMVNQLASWDGSSWTSLGLEANSRVEALAVYDDGGGPALYAAGGLKIAGNVERIAKWDGSSWTTLGTGIDDGFVFALAAFDDGNGSALFVGGDFTSAGGTAIKDVARWNGSSWSSLGSGLLGGPGTTAVNAMTVYDDGGGPALFVAGDFSSAGGAPAHRIAKWDGSGWSPLGNGVGHTVYALTVHEGCLYAGGLFSSAGSSVAENVARWDGSSWTALGSGIGGLPAVVYALTTHDDGSGPALYVGGLFSSAGGLAVRNLAKWDGASWSAVDGGTNSAVHAMMSRVDDGWPALYVGGNFNFVDSCDGYLAKWGCLDLPPALDCPPGVYEIDHGAPGELVTFTVTATDDHDPAPMLVCVPPSGSFFPQGTTIVNCTATDANGHESTCDFRVVVKPKVQQAPR